MLDTVHVLPVFIPVSFIKLMTGFVAVLPFLPPTCSHLPGLGTGFKSLSVVFFCGPSLLHLRPLLLA